MHRLWKRGCEGSDVQAVRGSRGDRYVVRSLKGRKRGTVALELSSRRGNGLPGGALDDGLSLSDAAEVLFFWCDITVLVLY